MPQKGKKRVAIRKITIIYQHGIVLNFQKILDFSCLIHENTVYNTTTDRGLSGPKKGQKRAENLQEAPGIQGLVRQGFSGLRSFNSLWQKMFAAFLMDWITHHNTKKNARKHG